MTKIINSFSPSISSKTQRKGKKQGNSKQKSRNYKPSLQLKAQLTKSIQTLEFVQTTAKASKTVYIFSSLSIAFITLSNSKCLNRTT